MKLVRAPKQLLTAQDSSMNFNSPSVNVLEEDNLGIQLNYSGSMDGNYYLQGSLDQVNWQNMYFFLNGAVAVAIPTSGNPSPILLDIAVSAIPYMRIAYVSNSGTGTTDMYMTLKRIGD